MTSHCDGLVDSNSDLSVSEAPKPSKSKLKTPMQFENLKSVLGQAAIHNFEGLRFNVQKQVNLNTVVSHL